MYTYLLNILLLILLAALSDTWIRRNSHTKYLQLGKIRQDFPYLCISIFVH